MTPTAAMPYLPHRILTYLRRDGLTLSRAVENWRGLTAEQRATLHRLVPAPNPFKENQ